MSVPVHAVSVVDGSTPIMIDRVHVGMQIQVANAVGGGAGASVVTTITWPAGALPPSGKYGVQVTADQPCGVGIGNRLTNSFDVTLKPLNATDTLAAGKFDVFVYA